MHLRRRSRTPRVLAVAFASVAALCWSARSDAAGQQSGPPRDNRQPPSQIGTSVVRGRIVAAETGKPLRRARVTLSAAELGRDARTGSTDLDLYLAPSSCQNLYPMSQCAVIVASNSSSGTQEVVARGVSSGESYAIFVDNLSPTAANTYNLNITIE